MELGIIIIVNLIFFFRTLRFGLVSDDILGFPGTPKGNFLKTIFNNMTGKWFCKTIEQDHCLTMLIHTFNCCLIYYVFGMNNISFMAALLFSINPANNQGSVWMASRRYLRYLTVLLLLYKIHLVLFILGLAYLYYLKIKLMIDRKFISTPIAAEVSIRKLVPSIKLLGYYFKFCIFPFRLGMYHNFLGDFCLTEEKSKKGFALNKDFWFGISILIFIAFGIIFNPFNLRIGLIWFLVCIIPFLHYPKLVSQTVGERYVYIANAGLMLVLAGCLNYTFFIAFFVFYLTRFALQINCYRNNKMFLEYNTYDINFLGNNQAAIIKGRTEQILGRWWEALKSCCDGLDTVPNDNRLNYLVAEILYHIGLPDKALIFLEVAAKNPIPVKGDITPAVIQLRKACDNRLLKKHEEENKIAEGIKCELIH